MPKKHLNEVFIMWWHLNFLAPKSNTFIFGSFPVTWQKSSLTCFLGYFMVPSVYRLKKVPFNCLESLEEKVVSAAEMRAMEMKCCLQRLQMASYLRHKSDWRPSYPNPLVCHAVHKSPDIARPREFEIRLRYKDNSMITVQIFYKTNTECLLRIL